MMNGLVPSDHSTPLLVYRKEGSIKAHMHILFSIVSALLLLIVSHIATQSTQLFLALLAVKHIEADLISIDNVLIKSSINFI